jgi:hypothetical protein
VPTLAVGMLTFIVSTHFMSSGLLVGMLINCKAVSSAFLVFVSKLINPKAMKKLKINQNIQIKVFLIFSK